MNDLISRQAAIDAIKALWDGAPTAQHVSAMFDCEDAIQALPSAQPVIHGRFIGTEYDGYADGNPVYYEWKCSECGCVFEDEEPTYNYCPQCGADMRGEQDE